MNRSNASSSNNPPPGNPGVPPPSGLPDNGWASAFQDASEAPPARVWSGIERQLDLDDEDGVLPLYPYVISRSVVFGRWATGIAAALLLAFLGWWSLRSDGFKPLTGSTIAAKKQPAGGQKTGGSTPVIAQRIAPNANAVTTRSDQYVTARTNQNQRSEATSLGIVPQAATPISPDAVAVVVVSEQSTETESVAISVQVSVQQAMRPTPTDESTVRPMALARSAPVMPVPAPTAEQQVAFSQTTRHSFSQSSGNGSSLPPAAITPVETVASAAPSVARSMPVVQLDEPIDDQLPVRTSPMAIRNFSTKPIGNERIVWFSSERPDGEPKQKTARKPKPRGWVSAGVVAASFDPSVALRAVSGLAYTNNLPSNALSSGNGPVPALALDSHAGRAIAMQASVGLPLSEHWTIETGLGYLNGQSTVQSPVRASALSTEKNGANLPTLYTDLVGNSANRSVASSAADMYYNMAVQRYAYVASTSYDRAVNQSVSNSYQFVQVPVQLSYELRPRRKFGLAFITGMVSNLFVRNTVADAVTVKAQDGVYRPLTVAGTAGMRLRFRPDKHWSASLAGMFQQSLQSITRPEVGVQASPRNMGVCFSVDRHF